MNYIVPGEGEVIHQAAGLRIFGGLTRHSAEKNHFELLPVMNMVTIDLIIHFPLS